jgi:prepilin-type N-terminal cleavage/methylation domain-containing protein
MKKINKGFTLVELLITLGVLSIIMIVSSEFLINLVNTSVKIQSKNEVEQNYNFIVTKITKMLQDSTSVSMDGENITFVLNSKNYSLQLNATADLLLNGSQISSAKIIEFPNQNIFKIVNQDPVQVNLNFQIIKDAGTKYESSQKVERIITLRRSYKN